jgi:hypothetical protein
MALSREHCHRVMKDVAATLHTLVEPTGLVLLSIYWNRECLATAIVLGVNDCDIKFLGVLRQMMSTGHSYLNHESNSSFYDRNLPAAPAPTTRIFFR